MQVVSSYANGMFCWVDLTTTDPVSAKVFYARLFGWEYEDRPTDMGTPYLEQEYSQALQTRAAEYEDRPTDMDIPYTNCQIDGYRVAGLVLMPESMQSQNIPPRWTSYIKHDDVDAVAEKVTEAGGTVTMPPMDVMTEGRLLMAQDPAGAVFCVWQPKNNTGAHLVNIPNTLVWNELQTRDAPGALRFYHSVFGWDHDADPSGYYLFKVNEHVHAGMLLIDDSWGRCTAPLDPLLYGSRYRGHCGYCPGIGRHDSGSGDRNRRDGSFLSHSGPPGWCLRSLAVSRFSRPAPQADDVTHTDDIVHWRAIG